MQGTICHVRTNRSFLYLVDELTHNKKKITLKIVLNRENYFTFIALKLGSSGHWKELNMPRRSFGLIWEMLFSICIILFLFLFYFQLKSEGRRPIQPISLKVVIRISINHRIFELSEYRRQYS